MRSDPFNGQFDDDRGFYTNGRDDEPVVPLDTVRASSWDGLSVPERRWVLGDWLPAGAVTGLWADGGSGKTLLVQQLGTCVVVQIPFLGIPIRESGPVLIVAFEDDKDELHRRQDAICQRLGVALHLLDDLHLVPMVGTVGTLMTFAGGVGQPTRLWHRLRERVLDLRPVLLVIDGLADIYGGNENDRGQVTTFVHSALLGLVQNTGGGVLVTGHTSDSADKGFSGSRAWNNSVRSRWWLQVPPSSGDEDEQPDDGRRVLTRAKANYAQRGATLNLRYIDGSFAYGWGPAEQAGDRETKAREVMREFVTQQRRRGIRLSVQPNATNNVVKLAGQSAEAKRSRLGRRDLQTALDHLLDSGELVVIDDPNDRRRTVLITAAEVARAGVKSGLRGVAVSE